MQCHQCGQEIAPEKGKIVQGNIYMVVEDEDQIEGLYGSCNYSNLNFKDVPKFAFCDKCFIGGLCLEMGTVLLKGSTVNIEQLIEKLQEVKKHHGNVPVFMIYHNHELPVKEVKYEEISEEERHVFIA